VNIVHGNCLCGFVDCGKDALMPNPANRILISLGSTIMEPSNNYPSFYLFG
jgi:hypothetical protein